MVRVSRRCHSDPAHMVACREMDLLRRLVSHIDSPFTTRHATVPATATATASLFATRTYRGVSVSVSVSLSSPSSPSLLS